MHANSVLLIQDGTNMAKMKKDNNGNAQRRMVKVDNALKIDSSILRKALKANPKTTVAEFKKQLNSEKNVSLTRGLGSNKNSSINPFAPKASRRTVK